MKILIIGFTKLKYMPYLNFYLESIDRNINDVHLLYWNRDMKKEDLHPYKDLNLHEFKYYQEDDVSKKSKITGFIKYRNFTKMKIKEGDFDFIFVLHTLPGVLIFDVLKSKYKNKFVFDYRDFTYENFWPYKKIVGMLVKLSKVTFVSSNAFRVYLPKKESHKIFTSHNLLVDSLNHREEKVLEGIQSKKIRIAFWGYIRHEEINREIIKKISEDDRFELYYYGREQQTALKLKEYSKRLSSKNVFFKGAYIPEDRYKFVHGTDLIHNFYDDLNSNLLMSNKYYDGIIFRIPQLCMSETYMGEEVTNKKVGLEINPFENNFTQKIWLYYNGLDLSEFTRNCDAETDRVYQEYNTGLEMIKDAIKS